MTAPPRLMTAQELLQYRHEPYQQELIGGILHEMEPPEAEHTVHRSADDVRVFAADEPLDLGELVPGWSPRVGELLV